MLGTTQRLAFTDRRFPLIVQPLAAGMDLPRLIEENRTEVNALLLEHGAVMFRGFDVRTVESFNRFVDATSKEKAPYLYRSTPRTSVGDAIYTATEYPNVLEIPLHNENAYHRRWPLHLAFCCITPPQSGGETPLADMRAVSARIGERLMDVFEERSVRYVRHYRPFVDLPWQVVFQTEDRDEVARYCGAHGIAHEWLDEQTLRTQQVSQGTACHPVSGERVFFNQAHLFHVSSLGAEDAELMVELYGTDGLPRQAYFGDGGEIERTTLETVNAAFRSEAVSVPWEAGDVVLLDNMQIAHGRRSFTGERKIITALLEPYSVEP